MLDVTRAYKLNNKITNNFNMLHQNALLTAAQSYRTHGLRFTGDWNNSELCDV
jgi:hypothetical protein